MTRYAWPPFPRPYGPIRAVCPTTGRTAQPGDQARHHLAGPGTVEDIEWDGFAGTGVPVVRLDGARHAHAYGWATIQLTEHDD